MLTKDEIEQELAKSEYSEQIRKSLSNYYEGLDENVAVAIDFRKFDRAFNPEDVQSVVSLLREQGIDAVSFIDKDASLPDKYVITQSGILCPNMNPQDALKATVYLEDLLLNNNYQLLGHANPQTAKSLVYTASHTIGVDKDKGLIAESSKAIDIKESHPNIEEFNRIEAKHGGNYQSFINEMVADAYANSEPVDFTEMSRKNVYEDGGKYLYRGGSLGNNPYATISEYNSRKVAHSSPAIEISGSFSGKGGTSSTKGGAFYPPTSDNILYGFIYEFESMGDKQIYYHNVGLEEGDKPRVLSETNKDWNGANGDIYESPVLPHHNKVHAIYLHVGKQNENKLYPILLDKNGNIADEKWRDFFAMHEPSDDKVVGYVADRQDKIKNRPELIYDFKTGEKLPPKDYSDLSSMPADELLKAFVHRDAISTDGKNIICKESLDLNFLGVEKIPNLSNIAIEGRFSANDTKYVNLNDLPYTTEGYNLGNATIDNCDKVDAETFCRKLGMEYKNGVWISDNAILNDGKFIGCPQNFANTSIQSLNFIDLTVDDLNEVPITKSGANKIKILNQESIKNMDVDVFLRKINGDNFDKFPSGTFNPDYKTSLNLEHTNIVELPKGLEKYNIESIVFPENTVVSSLDNIPITKNGCYNLNYSGDLSKETMESFLLKSKGSDWCANNLSRATDGHLIINGDFDFNTPNYSSKKVSNLDITSFPKDIDKVEFGGAIEPSKLRQNLQNFLKLQSQKNNETVSIHNTSILNYDLSDFKAKNIDIDSNFKSIKLPECAEKLSFENIDDLKLSTVEISDICKDISLSKVKSSEHLDLSKQSNIFISNSKLNTANFPQNCSNIIITNSDFRDNVELPHQTRNIELSGTIFNKGCKIKLTDCEQINLENCKFSENCTIDLSNCKKVTLSNVDLSKVNIKLPTSGKVYIEENVKFAQDYKLDFSKCNDATVHYSAECAEIKLPESGVINDAIEIRKLHKNVKEVTTKYIRLHQVSVSKDTKIIDKPDENGKRISLEALSRSGLSKEQIANLRKERLLQPFKNIYEKITGKNQQPNIQSMTENKASDLQETLKNQAETTHQNKVADAKTKAATEAKVADKDLHSTLKAQKEKSSLGSKVAAVSDGIDKAFEKGGAALNDNTVGRAINKADSWRPKNKFASKVMDKVGAVPVAAVVATGVSAYEQYKSGDKKGAAATFGKGFVYATVQGVTTSAGMNVAAKGVSKAAEKVTEKVVTHQTAKQAAKTAANAAAKAASKQVAKAAGKAAGKAVGKSVLKKIPLVSLGAGAYFAFERAKNGEWGKAGCELLSGALGCFPGVGTAASTAVDCGLAVADTKKAIDDTKKQQAKQTQKQQTPQKPKQQTKQKVTTQRVEELRNSKGSQSQQKTATKNKQVEKSFLNRLKDSLWSR